MQSARLAIGHAFRIFGNDARGASDLLRQGKGRQVILPKTGAIVDGGDSIVALAIVLDRIAQG
ncbi:hypothetical protein KTN05_16750 [Paracoccus sp. Z118]|uniref:hypothetical protein n=1 Tax=Paracoccus sp. Z118 TaxID=2851017 RepID=UPI001C2C1C61|nr:hypothetical protein [Paracoccus sp. Z118]MBV0893452.1 hypothetical protein [Paracoccus sp. Z118]